MQNPLVSILIPVYNRVALVGAALQSARNQTYQNLQIIISDNCSTDGTWEFLQDQVRGDSRIILVRTASNLGPVPNWKNCLAHSSGDYIKILFSDDWMREDCIQLMLGALIENHECDMAISSVIKKSRKSEVALYDMGAGYPNKSHLSANQFLAEMIGFKLCFSPGAILLRASAVKIPVGFKDSVMDEYSRRGIGPDILYCLYGGSRGACVVPSFVNTFREHSGSLTTIHASDIFKGYSLFLKYYAESEEAPAWFKFKLIFWIHYSILNAKIKGAVKRFLKCSK